MKLRNEILSAPGVEVFRDLVRLKRNAEAFSKALTEFLTPFGCGESPDYHLENTLRAALRQLEDNLRWLRNDRNVEDELGYRQHRRTLRGNHE